MLQRYFVLHLSLHIQQLNLFAAENTALAVQVFHALDVVLHTLVASELEQGFPGVPTAVDVAPVPPFHKEFLVGIGVCRVTWNRWAAPAF